jgi:thiazole synthase ThiGH ThiG subunit
MKNMFDPLKIGDKSFSSRLMLGTGKYRTSQDAVKSIKQVNVRLLQLLFDDYPQI